MLAEALKRSRAFFYAHGLAPLAKALPGAAPRMRIAKEEGFDESFVFPPPAELREQRAAMMRFLLEEPAPHVDESEQYGSEPWILDPDELGRARDLDRPEGAFLLRYRSGPFPDETVNQTGKKLDAMFAECGWSGLTLSEWLVLQRISCEKHGDHRFDLYGSQRQWLLNTRAPKGILVVNWNPKPRQANIGWCRPTHKNKSVGAHPALVVGL